MKYPKILEDMYSTQTVIAYDSSNVYHLKGMFEGEYVEDYNTNNTTNVTREFLDSTYGVVESKEHAEFIIRLCDGANIEYHNVEDEAVKSFIIYDGEITFFDCEVENLNIGTFKQITIPMPPKHIVSKEFKVEDEVTSYDGSKMTIKAICGDLAWCECPTSSLRMSTVHLDNIKPYEAILREKVWYVVANTELKDSQIDSVVTDLLGEFDIKGKSDEQ